MKTQTPFKIPSPLQSLLNDLIEQQGHADALTAVPGNTYYRSRLFTANSGPNQLVAAAQPLLVLISRLINSPHLDELQTIQQLLPHELKAFITRAQGLDYPAHIIALARYLLSTSFEDIIDQLSVINDTNEKANEQLQASSKSDNFFNLINQLRHQASTYIDLIELAYVILCIGYCGNYRYIANGKVELENLLENLYQVIREQRGDMQPDLRLADSSPITETKSKSSISLAWLSAIVASIIFSFSIGFSYVLNSLSHSVMMQLK